MSLLWRNPTNHTIGIDISDHIIRAVLIRHSKHKHVLKKFDEVELEEGWIQNGVIQDAVSVQEVLKGSLLKTISPGYGAAVVGLPEAHGFIKTVTAVDGGLEAEVARHLPFPYEEVVEDSINYGPTADQQRMVYGFAAIKKEVSESYWEVLSALGLHIRALEIESQAIARAYAQVLTSVQQISILVDIGRNHTTFLVVQNDHIDFTHTSQMISGKLLTAAIQKQAGWSLDQAEQQKIIAPEDPTVKAITTRFGVVLANELQRVVDFHTEHQATRSGNNYVIYLTGGGSQIPNLRLYLEDIIKYPIQPATLPKNVSLPKKMVPERFSYGTAIGLGIRQYLPL